MPETPAIKVFSDRARASALAVRRHQQALGPSQQLSGMANPKIAARVKEILAAKQAKGKKKAGGKGKKVDPAKAKEKAARLAKQAAAKQEREKAKAERTAKQAQAKTERAKAKAERVAAQAKKQQAQQKKLKQAAQAKRAKDKASAQAKGERVKQTTAKQAERTKAAKERLAKQAATKQERDKVQAKRQADSQAKQKQATADRTAKQTAAQQHKTRVLSEKIKRGEKLSASDQVDAEDAGLVKKAGKAMTVYDPEEQRQQQELTMLAATGQAISGQFIFDTAIKAGARHSKMDASHLDEAARHLHAAGATCPDCAPGDEPDGDEDAAKAIKGIMDNPAWYAQHECSDIMQAGNALSNLAMLIQSELSEEDEDDADISQLVDAARTLVKFIDGELDELEGAASDAADGRTAGDVPMAKAVDDYLHIDGGAIKAIGDADEIGGYAVLFGDAQNHDMERDYYTKATNFWLDDFGWPRPITYHHGMDAGTRDDPVIGHWTKAAIDDTGVWLSGQLDRAHAYYKAIKELAQRGYLKLSSDSAPQWVQREKQMNGANFVKRWPLVTASATVTPMEPRMLPVEVKAFLAEIGYEAIESEDTQAINPDAAKADGQKAADDERARAILLELDILALEETAR